MNPEARWLSSLPLGSAERELLSAAKRDLPPRGTVDRGWRALSVALGAASTAATLTSQAAAGSAASVTASNVAQGTATGTAAAVMGKSAATTTLHAAGSLALGATSTSIAVKATVIGFAIGVGAIGTIQLVQRLTPREPIQEARHVSAAATVTANRRLPPQRRSTMPKATDRVATVATPTAAPEATASGATARTPEATTSEVTARSPTAAAPAVEAAASTPEATTSEVTARSPTAAAPAVGATSRHREPSFNVDDAATAVSPGPIPLENSLSAQARDLAQIKRLLDAGAIDEALRRLQVSTNQEIQPELGEERDALHIEALAKANRLSQASHVAERFFSRYPNSPHRERIRKLLGSQ